MANPWDNVRVGGTTPTPVPAAQATGGNPWDTVRVGTHPGGNNFLTAVARTAGTAGTTVSRALDAQRWALNRAVTGESDPDKQMENLRRGIGIEGAYQAAGHVPVVGHAIQGVTDAVVGGATDPLTYETFGAGPLLRATGIGAKAAGALEKVAKPIIETPLGRQAFDFTHWGGQVIRERGADTLQTIRGAAGRATAEGSAAESHLNALVKSATKGLTGEEKVQIGQVLSGHILPEEVEPKLRPIAQKLRAVTDQAYDYRYKAAQSRFFNEARKGYNLTPEEQKQLAEAVKTNTAPEGRLGQAYAGFQKALTEQMPRREHYMPIPHDLTKPADLPSRTYSPDDTFDPASIKREDVAITTPEQFDQGFKQMAANVNRQVYRGMIHDGLGQLLDDPAVKKLLTITTKATGTYQTDYDKIKEGIKFLVGYPRAGVVSMTPRHAVNILDLLVNTVPPAQAPQVLRDTMGLAAKLVGSKTADEYNALTSAGRELGAISRGFEEQRPFFQADSPQALNRLLSKIPGLSPWSAMMNKITWAVDDAAKQTYAKMLVDTGEAKGLHAGGLAASRLVDYEHVAPIIEKLRYVAPFATFRASIPGAVIGGIGRNPARAAFLSRASGGTMYGAQPKQGEPGFELANPTADIGRALSYAPGARRGQVSSGSANYIRGTIGDPLRIGLTATQEGLLPSSSPHNWGTYGSQLLPHTNPRTGRFDIGYLVEAAVAGIPEAQAALEAMGLTRFAPEGALQEAARQSLGVVTRQDP